MILNQRNVLAVARAGGVCALLLALAMLSGCSSCKDYKARIQELDTQVADLQSQLAARDAGVKDSENLTNELKANLAKCQADKDVLVQQVNEVVQVRVPERLLFKFGSDKVRPEMKPTLQVIASAINDRGDWEAYVEGYTDTKMIKNDYLERWASNWELGAYRACAVVRYLVRELNIPPQRLAAISYGEYRPSDSNETVQGRANNRYVQITLHKPGKTAS
jgi:chemotaxis protein MotB